MSEVLLPIEIDMSELFIIYSSHGPWAVLVLIQCRLSLIFVVYLICNCKSVGDLVNCMYNICS
jgi:hypothetical protein